LGWGWGGGRGRGQQAASKIGQGPCQANIHAGGSYIQIPLPAPPYGETAGACCHALAVLRDYFRHDEQRLRAAAARRAPDPDRPRPIPKQLFP